MTSTAPPSEYLFPNIPLSDLRHYIETKLPYPQSIVSRSVSVPGTKTPGHSHIYRNAANPNSIIKAVHPALVTIYDYYANVVKNYPDQRFLGTRALSNGSKSSQYHWITYQESFNIQTDLSNGLKYVIKNNQFLHSGSRDQFVVTIYSVNRPEWVLTDLACLSKNLANTALYDSLNEDASIYILKQTESPIIVCSKDKIEKIIKYKKVEPQLLTCCVVSMDDLPRDDPLYHQCHNSQIELFDWSTILSLGVANSFPATPPNDPEDIYTISFTSGTTGAYPKGAVLTHRSGVAAITMNYQNLIRSKTTTTYCMLPLAHLYERMVTVFAMGCGFSIGMPSVHPDFMAEDLRILKPTYITGVPRIFNKLEKQIQAKTTLSESEFMRHISQHILQEKLNLQSVADGETGKHDIYDKLLINEIRKDFGFDNLVCFFSASAPLSVQTLKFLKAFLNVGVCQGYGATESFATISLCSPYEAVPGTSGSVCCTTELKFKSIPDLGYSAEITPPQGEVLIRGPQMFSCYYKNPEKTKEDVDDEGWFHTGDIAKLDENGRLIIIDRVKNSFKLSQGEYISPEKIEGSYLSNCELVTQMYVHGDSLQHYLVAIVGYHPEKLSEFLKKKFPGQRIDDLNSVHVRKSVLKEINSQVTKLKGYERLKNLYLEIEPLTIERNILTPTLKLKRPIALKWFRKTFDGLYKEGSLLDQSKF